MTADNAKASAWLAKLAEQIRRNLAAGVPVLNATPLAADTDVGSWLFDPKALQIADALLTADVSAVTVQGSANLFGEAAIPVALGYSAIDGACYFVLQVWPENWPPLAVLNTLGLPFNGLCIRWQYGPLALDAEPQPIPASSHLHYAARLDMAGLVLPFEIVPPAMPDAGALWRISGAFEAVALDSLQALLTWLGNWAPLPELPLPEGNTGLALTGMECLFDPAPPRLAGVSLRVAHTLPWPLLAGRIELQQTQISLGCLFDPEQAQYRALFAIDAEMALAGRTVQVGVNRQAASGDIALELRSADARLPDLASLARLAGMPSLHAFLPAVLLRLSGLNLDAFRVELAGQKAAVSLVSASLSYDDEVTILPGLALENLRLQLVLMPDATPKIHGTATALLNLAGRYIGLYGELNQTLSLAGALDSLPLSALAARLPGLPKAMPEIELRHVLINLESNGSLHFEASVAADFTVLAQTFNIPVPAGMAGISLSSLSLDVDLQQGGWQLALAAEQRFAFPASAAQHFELKNIVLTLGADAAQTLSVAGGFTLGGSIGLGQDLSLSLPGAGLRAGFDTGSGWTLNGEVAVSLFGKNYTDWRAGFDQGMFTLRYQKPLVLVDEAFASARFGRFQIGITRTTDAGSTQSHWGFAATGEGSINIPALLEASAHIELDSQAQRLLIVAPKPKIPAIPLAPGVSAGIAVDKLILAHGRHWSFAGAATLTLNGIPDALRRYLPSPCNGQLAIDAGKIALYCAVEQQLAFGPLAIKLADLEVPLGNPLVTIRSMNFDLGQQPALGANLTVAIPAELNRLLGWDEHFRPTTVFLNPSIDLQLSVNRAGIGLTLINGTSPLRALQVDRDGFCRWELGEVGQFSFQVPTLSFHGGAWQGSFGMRHGPLAVPLAPIKFLMRQLSIPGSELVPDSVPIPDAIDLTRLGSELPKLAGQQVWQALNGQPLLRKLLQQMLDALGGAIGDIEKAMPADLLEYLTLQIPESIFFDIDTAGPTLSLRTEDAEPLKFMLPWFAAMPPGLLGVQLKRLSLGQIGAGLGLLGVDGRLDYFDVVTLAVAVLPGVDAKGFRNRLTLKNTLAVLPPAFPMPIPLFYDDLQWELRSWIGLGLTTDWKNRLRMDLLATGGDLLRFFSQKAFLLSEQAGDGFDIQFQIGPNFIALPEFIGGKTLGQTRAVTPALPAGESLKRLLDSLKTGNPAYLITAIPLHDPAQQIWYRLGRMQDAVRFGPLTFGAGLGWCVATQQELLSDILPNPQARAVLGELNQQDVLQSLPKKAGGAAYSKGFVVMLMGEAGVAPLLEARVYFGMALTGKQEYAADNEGGFETGFVLQGTIATLLTLRIQGDIRIDRQSNTAVYGDCSLRLRDTELIGVATTVQVGKASFDMAVVLRLAGEQCRLKGGFHIDAKQVFIFGRFEWVYGKNGAYISQQATARFDQYGLSIELAATRFFGVDALFVFFIDSRKKHSIGVRGAVDISALSGHFLQSFSAIAEDIGQQVKSSYGEWENLADAYSGNMSIANGLAKYLARFAKELPGMVDAQIKDHAKWPVKGKSRSEGRKQAKAIAGQLKNVAGHLESADAEATKKIIVALIKTALAAKVEIDIFPFSYKKSIWDYSAAAKSAKKHLQQALAFIEKVPAQKLAAQKAKDAWKQHIARQNIADTIAASVKAGVGDIPQINAIEWETGQLFPVPALDKVRVQGVYKQKPLTLADFSFNFADPAAAAKGIALAFIQQL